MPRSWPEAVWERPGRRPDAPRLVLLHGLGADPQDMAGLTPLLDPDETWQVLAPAAPRRPVTIQGGLVMPAWYDILDLAADSPEDAEGIAAMATLLGQWLARGGGSPWVLGGFSQGAALSLYAALHARLPAQAVLAFSGYLPLRHQLPPAAGDSPPIFWGHGTRDSVLPLEFAQIGTTILEEKGYTLERRDYPMAHQVSSTELEDARRFLEHCLRGDTSARVPTRK
ncbi:phospholipase [Acidithiobacillus sp.]|uniref:alpha/beta hydrolase n=1 Tax=Acidithiobacillus sp. TaxID=1872118 RepID=UPI0025BB8E08|nr:phospholipase [Acidithiobacillus sp.]